MNVSDTSDSGQSTCLSITFDGYFIVESVALFSLAILALPSNIIFVYLLHKSTLFHPNVLFCMKTFSVGNIIKSSYFIGNAIYNAVLIYRQEALEMTRFTCASVHIPYWIASVGQSGTMCVIGLERLKATWHPQLDTNDLNRANLSVKFGTFFGHVIGTVTLLFMFAGVESGSTLCYCHVILVGNYISYIALAIVYVPGQVMIVLILLLVYKGNLKGMETFYVNTARLTLQQRFEMSANVKLTKMLLPTIVSHSIVYTIIFSTAPITNYFVKNFDSVFFVNVSATCFVMSVADTLANPILCVKYSEHLKKIWSSTFDKRLTRNQPWYVTNRFVRYIRRFPRTNNIFVNYRITPDQNNVITDKFWALVKTKNESVQVHT